MPGIPRATWGHIESGGGNPTLSVLDKVAAALQVPIEELTTAPRGVGRLYPREELRTRRQGAGEVRQLLPDSIPGMVMDLVGVDFYRRHSRLSDAVEAVLFLR